MGVRRALLIATDKYTDHGFQQLRAPESDTRELAAVLQDPTIGACTVSVLRNKKAHEATRAIEDFFADAARDDLRLIYLSGHGIKDEQGDLYFVTTDSRRDRLASTAILAEFVHRQIDRSRCRCVVVWLDCCYAGAFPSGLTHRGARDAEVVSHLKGKGRVIMTSSTALEYSFESGKDTPTGLDGTGRSVFTHAIIEGLRTGNADLNQDGLIEATELYDYVYKQVQHITPRQTPTLKTDVEGSFPIAAHPLSGLTGAALPTSRTRATPHSAVQPPRPGPTSPPTGTAARRGPSRRTVLLSAVGALTVTGIPTSLYLASPSVPPHGATDTHPVRATAPKNPDLSAQGSAHNFHGNPHYFARQPNGTLRHWFYDGAGKPHQDFWPVGDFAGAPASLATTDQQHVWVRDNQNNLQHRFWVPGTGFEPQDVWGHQLVGDPTAFLDGNQQHVFARGTGDILLHWQWNPTQPRDNPIYEDVWARGLLGDPTAIAGGGQQHVFGRGAGDILLHWWWDLTHPADKPIYDEIWGHGLVGDPTVLLSGDHVYVVAVDAKGSLQCWWRNGPTSPVGHRTWTGSGITGRPTALHVSGQKHLWARDTNSNLLHWSWSSDDPPDRLIPDTPWGQGLASDPTAILVGTTLHVFTVDPTGTARHWHRDQAGGAPQETNLGT